MMYESLKYYILRAWFLGLVGDEVVSYVCKHAGVSVKDVESVVEKMAHEMLD